MRETTVFSLPV